MIPRASSLPLVRTSILILLLASQCSRDTFGRPGGTDAFDPGCSDPRAIAIADLALRAVGGRRSLEGVRFLRFSFVLVRGKVELTRRTHLWDQAGRRLRYESLEDGSPLVAILGLDGRDGPVYRAGHRVGEPHAARLREAAFDAWRNDSYWLLMPYRLKDPGVCLHYEGAGREGEVDYDRLELTLTEGGPAPVDRYRADIDRKTFLIARWSRAPHGDRADQPVTIWRWLDWRWQDGLLFSREKVAVSGGKLVRITHPTLELYESLAEDDFLSPMPLAAWPER